MTLGLFSEKEFVVLESEDRRKSQASSANGLLYCMHCRVLELINSNQFVNSMMLNI